jgi:hypothetical protein
VRVALAAEIVRNACVLKDWRGLTTRPSLTSLTSQQNAPIEACVTESLGIAYVKMVLQGRRASAWPVRRVVVTRGGVFPCGILRPTFETISLSRSNTRPSGMQRKYKVVRATTRPPATTVVSDCVLQATTR